MTYEPHPIDTSTVALPEYLVELTERLAEHVHDIWAKQRIADGWRYGPRRDDAAKTNPDLVPYGDMPEAEKVYDRQTALETLKVILKLGYRITKG